jgi:N-acetylglucosaminyldiphosphoundecaprenol N-acetyl-beta-D-mannosaminyltransferase
MKQYRRVNILGCPFDRISLEETEIAIGDAISNGNLLQIVPGNIDMVMKTRRNPSFAQRLRNADLVIADGKPIVWAASLLGNPICGRVSGTDIVWRCAALSAKYGWGIALMGGIGDVAKRAALRMQERYPGASLFAIPTPTPLGDKENEAIVAQIRERKSKIVLAALGAPRQEDWIAAHLGESGALVGIGIGSAFDIISGDKPRAPQWMQDSGLEWFYRMLQEPRRLGKRYLVEDSPFLYHLALALLRGSVRRKERKYEQT